MIIRWHHTCSLHSTGNCSQLCFHVLMLREAYNRRGYPFKNTKHYGDFQNFFESEKCLMISSFLQSTIVIF